ncbi:MAG: four-carbon acid sugar kinase family protein [Bacillota bacterium]|nr:four-carbon acid sugar kinase family protein [Bacillota bacterium]
MPKCVMIADDLTGANGSGVLIKKLGLDVMTIMDLERINMQNVEPYDAVVYPTDSRAIEPEMAYSRVQNAMKTLSNQNVILYSKRIDSTFRGNIGKEIDAMLDFLGNGYIAVVVPVFPSAGRICCGGYLLVNGMLLQNSDAGRDPKAPVNTSIVENLLKRQTKRKIECISIETVSRGADSVSAAIKEGTKNGTGIFISDAISDDDILAIAQGAINSGIPFITADPGPFTASVLKKIVVSSDDIINKVMISVGSITNTTRQQIEFLKKSKQVFIATIDVKKLLEGPMQYKEEIDRVYSLLCGNIEKYNYISVMLSSINPEMRVDFSEAASKMNCSPEDVSIYVNEAVANVTINILKNHSDIKGIYSSGGDITVAICKMLESSGLNLIGEVIPLAAYGKLVGGQLPDISIVTKGGMVGDQSAAVQCLDYLISRL